MVEVQIGGTIYTVYTDAFGQFSLDVIGPGQYTLTISKNGFLSYSSSGQLNSNLEVNPVATRSSYTVEVLVVDSNLNPLPGVQIVSNIIDQPFSAQSDGLGKASFSVKHEFQYKVSPSHPKCYFEQSELQGTVLGNHKRVPICR